MATRTKAEHDGPQDAETEQIEADLERVLDKVSDVLEEG